MMKFRSSAIISAKRQSSSFLFLLFLFLSFFLPSSLSAADVRVLILDESYKSVPALNNIRRVGNMAGKLLYKGVEYQGRIEIFKGKDGLFVVNELPLEEYVKSVVQAEVGKDWPLEALKAQAVTVRTYTLYNINHTRNEIYHLVSSTLSQVYKGYRTDPNIEMAVNSTRGEILTYEGQPINAMYHSTSGGRTELPEEVFMTSYPYLKSVNSDCSTSPYYMWERRIPKKDISTLLDIPDIHMIEVISETKTGRAKELRIENRSESTVMKATTLRKKLGWKKLPSTWFSVSNNAEHIVFSGRGYGHGVGMCQWSAMEMAQKGKSYKEILSIFYPNTIIQLHEN